MRKGRFRVADVAPADAVPIPTRDVDVATLVGLRTPGLGLRPDGRPAVMIGVAVGAASRRGGLAVVIAIVVAIGLASGCRSTLRDECRGVRVGESFAEVRARLARTGAQYLAGPAAQKQIERRWWESVGFGARSCYLYEDASGKVARIDYHEGN